MRETIHHALHDQVDHGDCAERCPLHADNPLLSDDQREHLSRPEAWVAVTDPDGREWRVHWLPEVDLPRWRPLIEERARFDSPILPTPRHVLDPAGLWIAVPRGKGPVEPWLDTRARNPVLETARLLGFADRLCRTLTELHKINLVWMNFDPEELEIAPDGSLRPTNLDMQVYPAGRFPERLSVRPAYAAPEVCGLEIDKVGPRTDVFHLAMFCYCWLAGSLPDGLPGDGLETFAYLLPPLRIYVPDLPPGLAAIIQRGLAVAPEERQVTPADFLAELNAAQADMQRRRTFAGKLTWDIGAHTRAGRAKMGLDKVNEDSVLTKSFADPPRALLAVADGISICDVGTGALASSMTLDVVDKAFTDSSRQEKFPESIGQSCLDASKGLIDWAIAQGHEQALREDRSLMGTTLCVGWLQGSTLSLANRGDSRAYLVAGDSIEQLTVDGDMASCWLAEGAAPEQVLQLGAMGKALRDCVGGSQVTPTGDLVPWSDVPPVVARFPLVPGDVIILCSDGLIEEGAFLDPKSVLALVQVHHDQSAADLALLLAERADAMQRPPSPLEPEGYGDNISCIVVKVK